ncbi:hypothetical protein [Lentilactobacillus buchneri]|uniref:hypothetical protein n=1 Tax=Lentilactobacillus buchneri TaxID=1581 RepID=UPI00165DDF5F|nr:hypothetical protein [Lentilactobacillus buchneri]
MKKEMYQKLVNNFFRLNKEANDDYEKTKSDLDRKHFPDSYSRPKPRQFTKNRSPKV